MICHFLSHFFCRTSGLYYDFGMVCKKLTASYVDIHTRYNYNFIIGQVMARSLLTSNNEAFAYILRRLVN